MDTNTTLVSAIISAYNHENYIQDTIKSLIAQTYKNIELIIIDDGSVDSTWQKIQEMKPECEQRFCNVYFETKENEGSCITINRLLEKAQGEYIYFIASDDLAKPQAIEKEVEFLNQNPDFALVVGNNEIIDFEGKACYWDKDRKIIYEKSKAKYKTFVDFLKVKRGFNFLSDKFGTYETLYYSNYIPNGYLVRKSIFSLFPPFSNDAPLEDWYMMLQISKYSRMKYIDEILFSYRWHNSNAIKNNERMSLFNKLTRENEEKLLKNLDTKKVLPEVIDVAKNGACYKKQGLPFVLEMLTYKKGFEKHKIIKVFNIPVFRFSKKI